MLLNLGSCTSTQQFFQAIVLFKTEGIIRSFANRMDEILHSKYEAINAGISCSLP